MPRGSDPAPPRVETSAGLREMAARAQRLAGTVLDQQTITELTAFAAELEARGSLAGDRTADRQSSGGGGRERADQDLGQS